MTKISPKKKELRVVLSPEAYGRLLDQAASLDQTPASFARQVIMEKVTALEAAGSQSHSVGFLREIMKQTGDFMEEKRR